MGLREAWAASFSSVEPWVTYPRSLKDPKDQGVRPSRRVQGSLDGGGGGLGDLHAH